ncbi:MAG TPA: efflux RND transporter periplasmic adaptor subunit, partial [Bacteroidota bacterium]
MKIIFALTLIVLAALIAGCSSNEEQSKMSVSTGHEEEYYTCPMHPSVRSDKPGACPVCGMALVKKTALVEVAPSELADLAALSLSPTQRVLANVTTTPARTQRLIKEIIAAGVVESAEPRQATVSARFRGRIEKLFVAFTGEQVQKGQPLFELYSPDLISAQQEYLLALNGTNIASSADNPGVLPGGILQSARERLRTHFGMTDQQIHDLEQTGKTSTTI